MGGCLNSNSFGEDDNGIKAVKIPGTEKYIKIVGRDPNFPFVKRDHNLQQVMELFKKARVLGQGASCEVAHVIRKEDNQEFAMKIMKRHDKWNPVLFKQEYELLTMLDHPNILKYKDSYMDYKNFYFCTELCTGGELFDKIKEMNSFCELEGSSFIKTFISAIGHCHSKNIVHRDLKPENIVFRTKSRNVMVIIDFGDAKVVEEDAVYEDFVGTAFYLAPECVRERTGVDLKKSDMWTIGVITYVLLTGRPPFYGRDNKEILRKIIQKKLDFPKDSNLSTSAKDFIRRLVAKRPNRRLSAEKALEHKWLNGYAGTHDLGRDLIESLANYSSVSKLKKVLVRMLGGQLSESDHKSLSNQFDKMDSDADGIINLGELTDYLAKQNGNYEEAKKTAAHIIEQLDQDGDKKICRSEYTDARISQKLQDDAIIRQQFERIDHNGDGHITMDELAQLFNGKLTGDLILQMIEEVDHNNDGKICYDEFVGAMKMGCLNSILTTEVALKKQITTIRDELQDEKKETD